MSRDAMPLDVIEGRAQWCVVTGDCRDVLATLPAECVDLCLTDPPYGIPVGAAFVRQFSRIERMLDGSGEWNTGVDLADWLPSAAQATVAGGHIATFIKREDVLTAGRLAPACDLDWWHWFFIVKQAPPPTPRPTFVSAVEACAILRKLGARRRWYGSGYEPNRWIGMTPNRRNESHGHPTEKPLDPMVTLIDCLSPVGALILDPFAGSGTSGVAALQNNRRVILIEVNPAYADIARDRCERAAMQPRLIPDAPPARVETLAMELCEVGE